MIKDNRERFTLRIPSELFNQLQNKSNFIGVSLNALILQILWDWAKQTDNEREG
jgi:predicted HicB family RNase H-like nuclease|nr:MAG TPA: hypothetical protein [Bacteriophage sp.]